MLRHYGGWGYDHILRNVVPMMEDVGISQNTIANLLQNNPKSWLAPEVN
jgi:phosphotriesterase-related protein